ncbi:MAG: 3-phosphoglycerate dehydrogenase [Lachnospiraceae bacterium]|nr:3-phosphoglycerate dehydrogenase [Lachnospiraceae bacterium]
MMKIKCLNPIAQIGLNNFDDNYTYTEDLNEADAVLVRSASMHELELPASLLAIARAGAGTNNIPIDRCSEQGIVVFNTPGANANGVKELVLAGMLLASRDITGGINWVAENADNETIAKDMEKAKKKFAGTELKGKTLGVIGMGAIGFRVANAAIALGMNVVGFDPGMPVEYAWNIDRNVVRVNSTDEIFANSDFITIHVPLNPHTKGMLNKEAFAKMKDGVVILNYARDLLVNDADMAEALSSGKVSHYVTDFPNPDVVKMTNVIATPHLGASTAESEDNCAVMAVDQVREYLENGNVINSVNFPACTLGAATKTRICIFHENVPNIISSFSAVFGQKGINIADMVSKTRGDYAYSMFDVDANGQLDAASVKAEVSAVAGVKGVRIIEK